MILSSFAVTGNVDWIVCAAAAVFEGVTDVNDNLGVPLYLVAFMRLVRRE